MTTFDVAIVGAGPAGLSAAIAVAQAGLRVIVFEATDASGGRAATETLNARLSGHFSRLGVAWPADGVIACPAMLVDWSGAMIESQSIFSPFGPDWHVERLALRAALAERASSLGVTIRFGTRIAGRISQHGEHWIVAHTPEPFHARFLVLATGRGRGPYVEPVERTLIDRLVACIGVLEPPPGMSLRHDNRLSIAASNNGWWYACPAGYDALQLAYITDRRSFPGRMDVRTILSALVHDTPALQHLRPWRIARTSAAAADMSYRTPIFGEAWVSVGDAAYTLDPLSGQGVLHAVAAAETVATAAAASPDLRREHLRRYEVRCREHFARSVQQSSETYARAAAERDAPFWHSRIVPDLPREPPIAT